MEILRILYETWCLQNGLALEDIIFQEEGANDGSREIG